MTEQKNPDAAKSNNLLGIGVTGAVVMALCCFTPALVLFMAAVGLSSIVGAWMDLYQSVLSETHFADSQGGKTLTQ